MSSSPWLRRFQLRYFVGVEGRSRSSGSCWFSPVKPSVEGTWVEDARHTGMDADAASFPHGLAPGGSFGDRFRACVDGGQALGMGEFFGKNETRPQRARTMRVRPVPALPNDELEGGERDVVIGARHGQLGGNGDGVEVFGDLQLVSATDIPATQLPHRTAIVCSEAAVHFATQRSVYILRVDSAALPFRHSLIS